MIDRDQVLHVARLARLELAEAEVERFSGELSAVLEHVARIAEVAAEGVQPTAHVALAESPLRPDEAGQPLDRELALAAAPARDGEFFVVTSPQA